MTEEILGLHFLKLNSHQFANFLYLLVYSVLGILIYSILAGYSILSPKHPTFPTFPTFYRRKAEGSPDEKISPGLPP